MLKNPVVVDNQDRRKGTALLENQARHVHDGRYDERAAIPEYRERNFVMDEHRISQLFKSYFHNKMTLPLLLIQSKQTKPDVQSVEAVRDFLDDLFRHMLDGSSQKRYRLVFKWLKRFFEKLPDTSASQRGKARDFIRAIYDVFGLHLKDGI